MKELCQKFELIIEELLKVENRNIDISVLEREKAISLKNELQNYYNDLIDIHFKFSRFIVVDNIEEYQKIEYRTGKHYTLKQVLVFSEKRANVIQFKYLYPLNIRLNEFAEASAKKRDWMFLLLGIILGFLPELTSPWIKFYYPNWDPPFKTEETNLCPIDSTELRNDTKIKIDTSNIKNLDSLNAIGK